MKKPIEKGIRLLASAKSMPPSIGLAKRITLSWSIKKDSQSSQARLGNLMLRSNNCRVVSDGCVSSSNPAAIKLVKPRDRQFASHHPSCLLHAFRMLSKDCEQKWASGSDHG